VRKLCVNLSLVEPGRSNSARYSYKQDQRAPCGRSHDARPAACPRPTVVFRSILCGAAESPNHGPHMQYWFRRIFAYSKDFAAKLGCRKPAFGSDASRVGLYGVSFAVRTAISGRLKISTIAGSGSFISDMSRFIELLTRPDLTRQQ
jgi:hypothetical protein